MTSSRPAGGRRAPRSAPCSPAPCSPAAAPSRGRTSRLRLPGRLLSRPFRGGGAGARHRTGPGVALPTAVPPGRRRAVALAASLALLLALGGTAGADARPEPALVQRLDTLLTDKRLDGAVAGVAVADATTGETLYAHQSATRLMPASNTKLLTSTAAMDILGPDYRYHTGVLTRGARHGSRLDGDLYLRGSGDPTLLAADYDALAARVAAAGIRRVTGRLVADDTRFDDQRLGRSWAADDESAYYSSQISALSVAPDTDYDIGSVYVKVTPGDRPGDRPKVAVTPPNHYVTVRVTGTTGAAGGTDTLSVERGHGGNTLTVSGSLPADAGPAESWVSVWEPTGLAASVFSDALRAHGVRVSGGTVLGRATPHGARLVADHPSMPLSRIAVPFLKLSNNNHAEVLAKTLGYETAGKGTWSAGLAAISGFLKREGVDTSTLRQVDGSGLSRMDNVPPEQFTGLLRAVRGEPWFGQWYDALPVACKPDRMEGGTLRSRMCGTPAAGNVHGKTGTLTGASSLSGYVTDAAGRELVFSVVLNNYLASSVEDIEDAVAVALASHGAGDTGNTARGGAAAARGGTRSAPHRAAAPGLECAWAKPARC